MPTSGLRSAVGGRRQALGVATGVLWALGGCAGTPKPPVNTVCVEAQAVLQRFLDLDAETGRQWTPTLTGLITDTDGPGWDHMTVISGARILGCESKADAAELPVLYTVLGQLDSESGSGFPLFLRSTGSNTTERQVFRVVRSGATARVDAIGNVAPHISPRRALAQAEALAQDSSPQPARLAATQSLIATLRTLPAAAPSLSK